MYQFGPNDQLPGKCPLCGHLAIQHTRTPSGKRCIGNQWRCKCSERPLSMALSRAMIEELARAQATPKS
jgi:hypothetical protein